MIKAIVGANWGDEGKGKLCDMMAKDADIVVRYQGGANAGHTIVNEYGKFALHQLPSGVFHSNVTNVIANGVALSVENLETELNELKKANVKEPNILVSSRVQVVMPYHKLFDSLEEARLAGNSFGSTKSGIAPFYSDKYSKIGFQVAELFASENYLRDKLERVLAIKNCLLEHLYHHEIIKVDDMLEVLLNYKKVLIPYVYDTVTFMRDAVKENKNILLEGQLGALKDTDLGIYPMVTSSSTLAGFGAVGASVPANKIEEVVAVVKAYSSAVGAGAFVSEIFGDEANELREHGGDGGEYGATTGRARRMGWLDLVATKYGAMVQGATSLAFTCLDCLGFLDTIPVCTGYNLADDTTTTDFPVTPLLETCAPKFEVLEGWKCDIRGIKKYSDLPKQARDYVEFAEKFIGIPVKYISNGPARDDIIIKEN